MCCLPQGAWLKSLHCPSKAWLLCMEEWAGRQSSLALLGLISQHPQMLILLSCFEFSITLFSWDDCYAYSYFRKVHHQVKIYFFLSTTSLLCHIRNPANSAEKFHFMYIAFSEDRESCAVCLYMFFPADWQILQMKDLSNFKCPPFLCRSHGTEAFNVCVRPLRLKFLLS